MFPKGHLVEAVQVALLLQDGRWPAKRASQDETREGISPVAGEASGRSARRWRPGHRRSERPCLSSASVRSAPAVRLAAAGFPSPHGMAWLHGRNRKARENLRLGTHLGNKALFLGCVLKMCCKNHFPAGKCCRMPLAYHKYFASKVESATLLSDRAKNFPPVRLKPVHEQ